MKVLFDNVFLGSVIFVSAILIFVLVIAIFAILVIAICAILVIAISAILVIAIAVVSEEDFPDFFVEIDFYFGDFFVVIEFYYDFDSVSYVYDVGGFDVSNLIDSWI